MQFGPRIRLDSHTFGNLLKNVSPLAGAAVGGPLGLLLAGGLSATGDVARDKHPSIGNAVTNAGFAGGLGALRSAFVPSSTASGAVAGTGASSAAGVPLQSVPNLGTLRQAYTGGDLLKGAALTAKDGLIHGAETVGSAAVHNPLVVGQIASGVMGARAQNAETNLAQQQFGLQQQQVADQDARRKRLQELLAPLLSGYTGAR